jgi:hypothetical protein
MVIALPLVEALLVGLVASLIYHAIVAVWTLRNIIALWLALALIAWVGLIGPVKLG